MSGGIDWKNLLGSRGPQSVTASQAAAQGKIPWRTVTNPIMMSQPYPDRILKIQAAKNLGYDPNFQPDLSGVPPTRRAIEAAAAMRANEALSPLGMDAAKGARGLAGEPAEFEYLASELDREWISEAIASAIPPSSDLPGGAPTSGGAGGQPGPGSFKTLIPSPSPVARKRKRLEEIGLLA